MAAGEITQAALDDAKTYLTGSFPLRLTSNDAIAATLVTMQVDDVGIDYLERRNDYIEAVTLEDVRRVAARLYRSGPPAGGRGRRAGRGSKARRPAPIGAARRPAHSRRSVA